jgi:hypothetical protein
MKLTLPYFLWPRLVIFSLGFLTKLPEHDFKPWNTQSPFASPPLRWLHCRPFIEASQLPHLQQFEKTLLLYSFPLAHP